MKIVTPPPPIHTTAIVNDAMVITIPVKKRWFEIVWFTFCFIMCTLLLFGVGSIVIDLLLISAGLYGDVSSVNVGDAVYDPNIIWIFLIPLAIWLPTELMVMYSLLWRIVGKEIISANQDMFVVTRKILGWKSSKAYRTNDISALRISRPTNQWTDMFAGFRMMLGFSGTIAFDYGAKTFRFGDRLDEAEGRQIIKKIKAHLLTDHILSGEGL